MTKYYAVNLTQSFTSLAWYLYKAGLSYCIVKHRRPNLKNCLIYILFPYQQLPSSSFVCLDVIAKVSPSPNSSQAETALIWSQTTTHPPNPIQIENLKGSVILLILMVTEVQGVCSYHVHNLFTICSWLVHNLITICPWLIFYFFIICLSVAHDLFTSCSWLVYN